MFKTLRNARARTAANYTGVFVVATVLGTGVAAADPKLKTVMLDNGLPVRHESDKVTLGFAVKLISGISRIFC
jgi:hypothetical protein